MKREGKTLKKKLKKKKKTDFVVAGEASYILTYSMPKCDNHWWFLILRNGDLISYVRSALLLSLMVMQEKEECYTELVIFSPMSV